MPKNNEKKNSPRKRSPGKKKGSPGKDKGSPKKKKGSSKQKNASPDKKKGRSSDDPPLRDAGTQVELSLKCLLCYRNFKTAADLQSHLLTQDHFYYEDVLFLRCKSCSAKLHLKEAEGHQCAINKRCFIDQVLGSNTIIYGLPNICLLCRGRRFLSKAHLITHLICNHTVYKVDGQCGQCPFLYEHRQEVEILPDSSEDLPNYITERDRHIEDEHLFGYGLLTCANLCQESSLRFPYACTICGYHGHNNAEFQSHIIYYHGTIRAFETALYVCTLCDRPLLTIEGISRHIERFHVRPLEVLGKKLLSSGNYSNKLDFSHVCTVCWSLFEYDFHLQAHLIVCHGRNNTAYVCGWCKYDFSSYGSIRRIWLWIRRHELEHMNELHARALEFKLTVDPLIELPPSPDDLDALTAMKAAEEAKKAQKKKKSPKKKSPKKNSPKKSSSKSSPKKGSPEKKGKKK